MEEKDTKITIEQNINVINIENIKAEKTSSLQKRMGPNTACNRTGDRESLRLIGGGMIVCLAFVLFFTWRIRVYKERFVQNQVSIETIETAEVVANQELISEVDPETPAVASNETEFFSCTESETTMDIVEDDPVMDLYEFHLVGADNSKKVYSAVNSLGEELTKAFYLTSGFYTETVAFYLNGEYDWFYANLSCDERTKDSFTINIYLDDECVQSIRMQSIMAKHPVELDTTDATFVKFEILGNIYPHGAYLSDGRVQKTDKEGSSKDA